MPHANPDNQPTARRVLNLKALAIVAGTFVLFSILTGWLHAIQVVRTSDFLKSSGESALANGDPHRAFDLFEQYLVLNPQDLKVDEQISTLLEEHATTSKPLLRAFHINERLLNADKSRDDLRVRQIRLSDRLGRYSDAAVHLKEMRRRDSDLSEVWHFSGIVARDTGDFTNARDYFRKAITLADPLPESFEYLAQILTGDFDDTEAAEEVLDRMISTRDTGRTRQIRAAWLLDQDRPQDALIDIQEALRTDEADIRNNAMALRAIRQAAAQDSHFPAKEQYRQIIAHLSLILERQPDEPELRMYLAAALWAIGQQKTAIEQLQYGIERDPRQYEMHEVLVDYLVSARDYQEAQNVFDRIPQNSLDRGRSAFMQGRLLMAQENWTAATEAFERALGFAQGDQNIASRSRICLALCRSEAGDDDAAMDNYRALIQSDPESESGRLGIASAYLRANQTALAIAEYRQLLHVEGVPEFLANLMIRHIMTQPPQSRDWSDVEELLRNDKPLVKDDIQRVLLRADLLFAQGYPSRGMDTLDRAARRMPGRAEIQRAVERLSSIHGESLNQRILQVLSEDPTNMEAHLSVLRLQTARKDTADMLGWLDQLTSGTILPALSQQQRWLIVAQATTAIAEAEQATRGRSEQTAAMLQYAGEAWRRLMKTSPRRLLDYVRFLTRHHSAADAVRLIRSRSEVDPVPLQAKAWLACLRGDIDNAETRTIVADELSRLISSDPSSVELRVAWVDALLLAGDYSSAQTLLQKLSDQDPHSGRIPSRQAWLSAMIHSNAEDALRYSAQASLRTPTDPTVRSIRGLALAESGQLADALEVLTAIPGDERTMATELYVARALFLANRRSEASDRVLDLMHRSADLAPAEVNMLKFLQQQLKIKAPQVTQR